MQWKFPIICLLASLALGIVGCGNEASKPATTGASSPAEPGKKFESPRAKTDR